MAQNHAIAIVGNKDTILGFKALGFEAFNATNSEEAVNVLTELKSQEITSDNSGDKKPKYAIIFITEELAAGISKDDYKKLSERALPAIIPVPSSKGTSGFGIKRIGKMVEQAVGSDIFKE